MHTPLLSSLARLAFGTALFTSVVSAQTLSWTKRNTNHSSDITMNAAAYGGGKYAVVGYRGTANGGIENQISTSADGTTWSATTIIPGNVAIRGLTYGAGVFAATVEDSSSSAASNANRTLTSPDAVTWTSRNSGAGDLSAIAYANGLVGTTITPMFIAVCAANAGNNVARSTDGLTWTRVNTGKTVDLFQVASGSKVNVFVAISRSGTMLYSSNGTTWTQITVPGLPSGAQFSDLSWDGSEFLLVVNDSTQKPRIYVTTSNAAHLTVTPAGAAGAYLTNLSIRSNAGSGAQTLIVGKELEIRRALSPSHLYSSAFDVEREGPDFVLHGRGWGHGVGLCQIGAAVMARRGKTYREILGHYYPGTFIGS